MVKEVEKPCFLSFVLLSVRSFNNHFSISLEIKGAHNIDCVILSFYNKWMISGNNFGVR